MITCKVRLFRDESEVMQELAIKSAMAGKPGMIATIPPVSYCCPIPSVQNKVREDLVKFKRYYSLQVYMLFKDALLLAVSPPLL